MLNVEEIKKIIESAKAESVEEGDILLNTLHKIQDRFENNYIPPEVGRIVAQELGISETKVYEVLTFYTMFSVKPRGKYVIRVCNSLPCHVTGGREIIEAIKKELKIDFNQTTEDGMFTLETTGCLGLCGVSPVIMINDEYYGHLTPEKVVEIIRDIKAGENK